MKTINTSRNIYLQETHFNKYDIIKANENRMDFNLGMKKQYGNEMTKMNTYQFLAHQSQAKWIQ